MIVKNKILAYFVSFLFSSPLAIASETPSVNYPLLSYRVLGEVNGGASQAAQTRKSSAFFHRSLGTEKQYLRKHFKADAVLFPERYHLWEIEKQKKVSVFRLSYRDRASKLWAAYMFEDKNVSGYALVDPLFLTTSQDGVFDNEPFFQQLYQLPQVPQWLNLNLPPGYTLRLYRAPHASQVEVYGILETPRGIKALVLETFFPQELESWLKPQIKQYLKDLILSFELSYEKYIPAGN